jgi:hypothetical protein
VSAKLLVAELASLIEKETLPWKIPNKGLTKS